MLVPRSSVVRQKRAAGEKSNHRPPFRRGSNLAEPCVASRVDGGLCLVVFVVRERLYLHAQSSISAAVHGTAIWRSRRATRMPRRVTTRIHPGGELSPGARHGSS